VSAGFAAVNRYVYEHKLAYWASTPPVNQGVLEYWYIDTLLVQAHFCRTNIWVVLYSVLKASVPELEWQVAEADRLLQMKQQASQPKHSKSKSKSAASAPAAAAEVTLPPPNTALVSTTGEMWAKRWAVFYPDHYLLHFASQASFNCAMCI